ncbi:MAG: response regulator [Nitrospinae bacterium]|nr:response regulator [Nitrospinota bacterium]
MAGPEQVDKKKLSILVVDDFPNMRRTIKNMLHSLGYMKLTEAGDGDEATETIDRLHTTPSRIQLVILDWNMPRVHGIDVLRFIRNSPRHMLHVSVLMVTAENWAEEIIEAAEDNVDGYIIKPFVAKTLELKINQILEKQFKPTKLERIFRDGIVLMNKKEFGQAKAKFEELLAQNANSPRSLRELAKIAAQDGDNKAAEEYLKKALEINKDYTKAMQDLGAIYAKEGRDDEGIKMLEGALKLSPRNADRLALLGNVYFKKQRYQEIIDMLEKARRYGLSMIRYDIDVLLAAANLEMKNVARAKEILLGAVGNAADKDKVKEEIKKAIAAASISEPDKEELTKDIESA